MAIKRKLCPLCLNMYAGRGHNPWPLSDQGWCCVTCNAGLVNPARIMMRLDGAALDRLEAKAEAQAYPALRDVSICACRPAEPDREG